MLGAAKIQDWAINSPLCLHPSLSSSLVESPEFAGFARRRYRTKLAMLPARKHIEPIR